MEKKSNDPLFAAYYERWLQTVRATQQLDTWAQYQAVYQRLFKPLLGTVPVAEITAADIARLKSKFEQHTEATVHYYLAPLSAMFRAAVAEGIAARSPVRLPSVVKGFDGSRPKILDTEQRERLLAACRESYRRYYGFILFLLRTGAKVGEARALEWEDIDFHNKTAWLQRTIRPASYLPVAPRVVYSVRSPLYRRVGLEPELHRVLRAGYQERHPESPLVFCVSTGAAVDLPNFRRCIWLPLLEQAALPGVRLQDLRHTYAVELLRSGVDRRFVQQQLGHQSTDTVATMYRPFLLSLKNGVQ